jgi:hypothetical protein
MAGKCKSGGQLVLEPGGGMRFALILCALLALSPTVGDARGAPPSPVVPAVIRAPDHVLLWGEEAAMAGTLERLGFKLKTGSSFEGAFGSQTIMFADYSFLELLHVIDRTKATSARARDELAFVDQGPGANSFAFQVSGADPARAQLEAAGFKVGAIEGDTYDPDGPGGPKPVQPASWRDFHFAASPLHGAEVFFIEYAPDAPSDDEAKARFEARVAHPNTARSLSAIWIAVADPAAEAAVYRRMGFKATEGSPWTIEVGPGRILLVPLGPTSAGQRQGPRIVGLSIAVADLTAAERRVREAYPSAGPRYAGTFGPSVRSPTEAALGLFIEFHAGPARPQTSSR